MPKFRNIRIKKPGGGFRMQRAQVLKSGKLKFVKNVKRGGTKAAKKAPARKRAAPRKAPAKRRKSVAKKGNPNNNKPPKIGAAIQAFKGAHALFSPVAEAAVVSTTPDQFVSALRSKANIDYAVNLGVEGINQAVDRRIAHGGALSRGSLTAWAAEGFAAFTAFQEAKDLDGRNAARAVNFSLSRTIRGYDPPSGKTNFSDPNFRTDQTIKILGGVARRLSSKGPFKKITAPAKKLLGEMGGAL